MNALQYSKEIKEEANVILQESGILEILKEYGDVEVIGSYALDVMYRPDIDILVFAHSHNRRKAKEVTIKLLNLDYFNELCFVNKVGEKSNGTPQGYYLQPHKRVAERDWKFDIWLTTRGNFDDRNDILKKRIMSATDLDETKQKIVMLKEHFSNGTKYNYALNGNKIYNAVLDNPELKIDELKGLLTK